MARWSEEYPGQSGHIHVSVKDRAGAALFYYAAGDNNMSVFMSYFLGGGCYFVFFLTESISFPPLGRKGLLADRQYVWFHVFIIEYMFYRCRVQKVYYLGWGDPSL